MDADQIREKMVKQISRIPSNRHPEWERRSFVQDAYREQAIVHARSTGLEFEVSGGTRVYNPATIFLSEDDYGFFREAFDDEMLDGLDLARAYLGGILHLCGLATSWEMECAIRSLGSGLPDLLAVKPPEEVVAIAIRGPRSQQKSRVSSSTTSRANPNGDWSLVRASHGSYYLTPVPARCFAAMVEREAQGLPIYWKAIREAEKLGPRRRIGHVFKNTGAWNTLIKPLKKKSPYYKIVW